MPRCIVPGCTIDYESNSEKIHCFLVPKDEETKDKWKEALQSSKPLGKKSAVCERHFRKKDIIRVRLLTGPDGKVVGVSPYSRPKLKTGAVPHCFPWTTIDDEPDEPDVMTVLLKSSTEKSSDTVRINIVDDVTPSDSNEDSANPEGTNSPDLLSTDSPPVDESLEKDKDDDSLTFSDIQKTSMPLPPSWIKVNLRRGEENFVTFTEITFSKDKNDQFHSIILKEIVIDSNLEVRVYILGEKLNCLVHGLETRISSQKVLEQTIGAICRGNICKGCQMPEAQTDANGNTPKRDCRGDLRHNSCELLTSHTFCKLCRIMKRSYLVREKRRKKRMSRDAEDSSKRKKLSVRYLQKKIGRREKRIEGLVDENRKLKKWYVHLTKKCEKVQEEFGGR